MLTKLRRVRRRRCGQRAGGPHAPEGITTIGQGVVIEGEVKGGEDIVIDGKVDGTIELPQHVLTVGPTGGVKAEWRRILPATVRDALLFEVDLDRGLEKCEDTLLAAAEVDLGGGGRGRLLDSVTNDLLRHLDSQIAFEEMVHQLEPWVERRDYRTGDPLALQGETPAGVQLLVKGSASVYRKGVRLFQCAAGDAIEPLAAFGAYSAQASTIADGPCRTMLFTPNARLLLEEFHPKLGLEFYRFLMTCEHARNHRAPNRHDLTEQNRERSPCSGKSATSGGRRHDRYGDALGACRPSRSATKCEPRSLADRR